MSRPSQLLSKISVPNSSYPGLALTRRDFRLNFCINIGSRVMLESVPIYRAETLDRQMDDVRRTTDFNMRLVILTLLAMFNYLVVICLMISHIDCLLLLINIDKTDHTLCFYDNS
jgi:hypothetical protein